MTNSTGNATAGFLNDTDAINSTLEEVSFDFNADILGQIEEITSSLCPNDCSNNGNCVNGVCNCNSGELVENGIVGQSLIIDMKNLCYMYVPSPPYEVHLSQNYYRIPIFPRLPKKFP